MIAKVQSPTIHEEAHALINSLPESVTWDDILDAVYARLSIERGLQDIASGRTTPHEEVAKAFGFA